MFFKLLALNDNDEFVSAFITRGYKCLRCQEAIYPVTYKPREWVQEPEQHEATCKARGIYVVETVGSYLPGFLYSVEFDGVLGEDKHDKRGVRVQKVKLLEFLGARCAWCLCFFRNELASYPVIIDDNISPHWLPLCVFCANTCYSLFPSKVLNKQFRFVYQNNW